MTVEMVLGALAVSVLIGTAVAIWWEIVRDWFL